MAAAGYFSSSRRGVGHEPSFYKATWSGAGNDKTSSSGGIKLNGVYFELGPSAWRCSRILLLELS